MDYKAFKNLLKNYYDYVKGVEEIEEKISNLLYEMTGVKGVRYDKEPVSYNPNLSEQKRLELIEKKEELELELDYTLLAIQLIETKLSKLSEKDKEICLGIIARNISYEAYGNRVGYTDAGMWKKVKRDLERVL